MVTKGWALLEAVFAWGGACAVPREGVLLGGTEWCGCRRLDWGYKATTGMENKSRMRTPGNT